MIIIIGVVNLVVGILIITNSIYFFFKKQRNVMFSIVSTLYALVYFLIPGLIFLLDMNLSYKYIFNISSSTDFEKFKSFCISVLGYLVFFLIYSFTRNYNAKPIKNYDLSVSKKGFQIIYVIAIGIFLISALSMLILVMRFGGLANMLSYGDQIRGGFVTGFESGVNRSFVEPLSQLVVITPFLFFLLSRIKKTSIMLKVLLIISLILTIIALLYNSGRSQIIFFVAGFVSYFFFQKFKKPFIPILLFIVISLSMLQFMDKFFLYMSTGIWINNSLTFEYFIESFAFPYSNLISVDEMNSMFGLRQGIDYFTWMINILPSPLLNILGLTKQPELYEFTTQYYGRVSGVPTDILTHGIRQIGFIGALINMVILGLLMAKLDSFFNQFRYKLIIFVSLYIAIFLANIVTAADLDSFIRYNIGTFLLIIALFIVEKFQEMRSKNSEGKT